MSVLGIIPARGGSKGIVGKNIHEFCGKPLIAWTIEAAKGSRLLTRCILSSDDPEIISVAKRYDLEVPFVRPPELAKDDTPALPVIKHAVTQMAELQDFRPDYIVLLQPTSPLRQSHHVDEALTQLMASDADSIVSVVPVPHNCNPYSVMALEDGALRPFIATDERQQMRQQKPQFYARNGAAIYAFSYACLMEKNSIYGDTILPYFMPPEESIDIDEPIDLEWGAFMVERNKRLARE